MELAAVFFKKSENTSLLLTLHNNYCIIDLQSNNLLLDIIIPKSEEEIVEEDFSIVFSKNRLFSSSFIISCPPKKTGIGSKSPVLNYERTENLHFMKDEKKYCYTQISILLDSYKLKIATELFSKNDFYLLSIKQKGVFYPKMNIHIRHQRGVRIGYKEPEWVIEQRLSQIFTLLYWVQNIIPDKDIIIFYCNILKQLNNFDIPLLKTLDELTSLEHNTKESIKNITTQVCDKDIVSILATDQFFWLYQFLRKANNEMVVMSHRFSWFFDMLETEFKDFYELAYTAGTRSAKVSGLMAFAQLLHHNVGIIGTKAADEFVVVATEAKCLL